MSHLVEEAEKNQVQTPAIIVVGEVCKLEDDFAWAKKVTEEYRRIRNFFSKDFYSHGSKTFDDTSWSIWQYNDPETQSGVVMAFRRSASPFDNVTVNLKGLADGEYAFENLDTGEEYVGGSELKITLPQKRTSSIICYTKK